MLVKPPGASVLLSQPSGAQPTPLEMSARAARSTGAAAGHLGVPPTYVGLLAERYKLILSPRSASEVRQLCSARGADFCIASTIPAGLLNYIKDAFVTVGGDAGECGQPSTCIKYIGV